MRKVLIIKIVLFILLFNSPILVPSKDNDKATKKNTVKNQSKTEISAINSAELKKKLELLEKTNKTLDKYNKLIKNIAMYSLPVASLLATIIYILLKYILKFQYASNLENSTKHYVEKHIIDNKVQIHEKFGTSMNEVIHNAINDKIEEKLDEYQIINEKLDQITSHLDDISRSLRIISRNSNMGLTFKRNKPEHISKKRRRF